MTFTANNPLKVVELFAGIGAFRAALQRLGINHEVVAISEIDPYPVKAYTAMYGDTPNLGDITKIERLPKCDLLTYGFPCQDISLAGHMQGLAKGSGTRSGLLWEVERLLTVSAENDELPTFLIMENVKNLVSKKFKPDFDSWLNKLESFGYNNYYKVLNSKDYGIPQNRERVFCISILKSADKGYTFPEPQELKLFLVDMLEDEVDEKYFLSDKYIQYARENYEKMKAKGNNFRFEPFERERESIAKSITSRAGQRMTDNFIIERSSD